MLTYHDIVSRFKSLDLTSQELLLSQLQQEHELQTPVLEKAKAEYAEKTPLKVCPHCGSKHVNRRGKSKKGIPMFSCKDCKKWYSLTTGTSMSHIHKKKEWIDYLKCINQGLSIRESAKQVGISIQTSFTWRHKILAALDSLEPEQLSGTVECDELELPINEKGSRDLERKPRKRGTDFSRNDEAQAGVVQVVTAVERKGNKMLKAVETMRISKENIETVLNEKLANDTVFITDKHHSYKAFGKSNEAIEHKSVKSTDHISKSDKRVHLQTVNQTHKQLRDFLNDFNGVSTKYLQNYLNWYAYQDKIKQSKNVITQWVVTVFMATGALELYQQFLQNIVNIRT